MQFCSKFASNAGSEQLLTAVVLLLSELTWQIKQVTFSTTFAAYFGSNLWLCLASSCLSADKEAWCYPSKLYCEKTVKPAVLLLKQIHTEIDYSDGHMLVVIVLKIEFSILSHHMGGLRKFDDIIYMNKVTFFWPKKVTYSEEKST